MIAPERGNLDGNSLGHEYTHPITINQEVPNQQFIAKFKTIMTQSASKANPEVVEWFASADAANLRIASSLAQSMAGLIRIVCASNA